MSVNDSCVDLCVILEGRKTVTHPSKNKGNTFERELVNQAIDSGLEARRAYGSNGEALGFHATVDLVVEGQRLQAKRRKAIPAWLGLSEHVDAVVVRADYKEALVLISWFDYLDYLKWKKNGSIGQNSVTDEDGDHNREEETKGYR